jgi:hypothetical protein
MMMMMILYSLHAQLLQVAATPVLKHPTSLKMVIQVLPPQGDYEVKLPTPADTEEQIPLHWGSFAHCVLVEEDEIDTCLGTDHGRDHNLTKAFDHHTEVVENGGVGQNPAL